jgi:hypothetical protein
LRLLFFEAVFPHTKSFAKFGDLCRACGIFDHGPVPTYLIHLKHFDLQPKVPAYLDQIGSISSMPP